MKSYIRIFGATIPLLLVMIFFGCSDMGDDPVASNPEPADTTRWLDISGILSSNCMICHGADNSSQYFNASSYTSVVNHSTLAGNALVDPENAGSSELIWRLEAGNGFNLMPAGGPSLSQTDIDVIKTWINQGALE